MLKKMISFSLIGLLFGSCNVDGLKNGYYIESDTVFYYSGFPAHKYIVHGADVSSFKTINKEYATDKKQVFYKEHPVKKADPTSFKVMEGFYSKDKNYGFAVGANGPDAVFIISYEPDYFEIVSNPEETPVNHTAEGIMYARDRQHVYYGRYIFELADPITFEYVPMRSGSGYDLARDKKYVYWHQKPIEGADGGTFQKISTDYFKDAKAIWSTRIDNRGNTSWVVLTEADISTFKVIDPNRGIAQDKNHSYKNGDIYIEPDNQ
ncbi:DKNYY domain-containing protein [Emticicia sp. BO119]|uniref:DKNYY domain-containing protein n=1 Tax=Emticicia sp. BO119 TaxID=2757768 RepID=UPI0015F0ADC7|nr:DKNYY domain-containing protein [Emticicia sp. BO119]MBA4850752.1 DKNYY domain-containing protein [Emticicia sp. BO119]